MRGSSGAGGARARPRWRCGLPVDVADHRDQLGERTPLGLAQIGIPDVGEQDGACRWAAIPRFVLVGVVEGEALPDLPRDFIDPDQVQLAVVGNLESEVEDRARVRDAAVREDVGARSHDREADLGAVVAHVIEGQLGQHV